jgi:predicted GNAT family acetyltransferase
MSTEPQVRDASERSRFEIDVDGHTAVLDYRLEGDVLRLIHTGVPAAVQDRGIGTRLAEHALDSARKRGLDVMPECEFVAAFIREHPEYLDLVPERFPQRSNLERGTA